MITGLAVANAIQTIKEVKRIDADRKASIEALVQLDYIEEGGVFIYGGLRLKKGRYSIGNVAFECRVLDEPPPGRFWPIQILIPELMVTETLSD